MSLDDLLQRALRRGDPQAILRLADEAATSGEVEPGAVAAARAVAARIEGHFSPDGVAGAAFLGAGRDIVRRHLVEPLAKAGDQAGARRLLDRLIAADPEDSMAWRRRGALRARGGDPEGALSDAREAAWLAPGDPLAQIALLQGLLQARRPEEAAEAARAIGVERLAAQPRLALLALIAWGRVRAWEEAGALADALAAHGVDEPEQAAVVVRALFEAGRYEQAAQSGTHYVEAGLDNDELRRFLGQALLRSHEPGALDRAIEHLHFAAAGAHPHASAPGLLGEALLRAGRPDEAVAPLREAVRLMPKVGNFRALLARALKSVGAHDEAASQFVALVEAQPDSQRWNRYAAGALAQAGREAEAQALFDRFVQRRASALPRDFESGLEALWAKADALTLPRERLDWAWSLQHRPANDRAEWELRAKWGHLADLYILDWLEGRDRDVDQAMRRLADLSPAEAAFAGVDLSRGSLLVSAHVGPLYAGPLALELLGLPSRWLASTPSVARTAYARSLISTSDRTGMEVANLVMTTLDQGASVVMAIDGAINLAAPREKFAGQEVTYSAFASRMAHRARVPSFFVAPRWTAEHLIDFVVVRLPDRVAGEGAAEFSERWKTAYFDALADYLGGLPENLRLAGGIWRSIRAEGAAGRPGDAGGDDGFEE